ncbi:hypothetical protein [Jiulongibacter sp. NS-SX5]|uniref:hypothetical protein n=1 Tax=Jiulongibacter sp. NS-SX5 TaxID=3463854 RepID=UPI00405889FD
MAESFSLAEVSADLQDYALDHQEYIIDEIFQIGFGGVENSPIVPLDSYVNILPADGEVVLSDLVTGDPLQPGEKDAFNAKAYATYKTQKAKPEPIKVDLLFSNTRMRSLYNTYMAKVKGAKFNPEEMPFEQWLLSRLNKDVQKYMRLAFWNAVSNPGGTSSADLFDGIVELITDTIANDLAAINVTDLEVKLSELTVDNCVPTFEKMLNGLDAAFAYGEDAVCVLPKNLYDLYNASYRKLHGTLNYNEGYAKRTMDGSSIEMIIEEGITTFSRPIITTRDNLVMLYNGDNAQVEFDYQKRDRSLAYVLDFEAGAGACATERIYVGAWTPEA